MRIISHLYLVTVIINEVLILFKEDVPIKEQQTALQCSLAHSTVYIKFIILLIKTKEIKLFFKEMFEVNTTIYRCLDLEEAAKRRAKINSLILTSTMYYAIFMATVDAIRAHINTGKLSKNVVLTVFDRFTNSTNTYLILQNRGRKYVITFIQIYGQLYENPLLTQIGLFENKQINYLFIY